METSRAEGPAKIMQKFTMINTLAYYTTDEQNSFKYTRQLKNWPKKAGVFVLGRPFLSRLMFAARAKSLP